ncbi:hypothetical protein FOZ61_010488 [Perkinsus olseni]|uniref:Succinate--hydroxymethylglutarate CoA-transferase n=1 Tax=Perkinsus olseni TaxID=32597 RepID=A0A7J6M9K5_PEROL|nr:hypothetical protein FOZ61_010488 [Perkinsus olseni]KAF4668087.1 hypothetical protein FOL46_002152 [Perkinsus olseni]
MPPPHPNALSGLPRGIMENLRVLELSTYIAGPGAGLIFTELGATTIKVETPSTDGSNAGGDPMRQLLLPFEPGRPHSSIFEMFNRGKESICLNLKKEKDIQLFWELLKEADVFITNVRIDSLCSLGIDHRTVCAQLPSLIYVLMTAWGTKGQGYQKPGYDVGAFWAASGATWVLHEEGAYSIFPLGLGDSTTACAAVAGIATALYRRMSTGKGQLVDCSLLHVGSWCMSYEYGLDKPGRTGRREDQYLHLPDGEWVAVLDAADVPKARLAIKGCKRQADGFAALAKNRVPCFPIRTGTVKYFEEFPEDPVIKPCLVKSPAVDKTCILSAIPFHVTGMKPPKSGAPVFNAQENLVRRRGFQEAGPRRFLPSEITKAPVRALEGVVVVELSVGDCLGIRAAGAILADYGATVVTCNMLPDSHFERGKHSVTVAEIHQLFREKGKVTGVICEQSDKWLRDNGLDAYLADGDDMIVLRFRTGMGIEKDGSPQYHTDFAGWWVRSGMISLVKGIGGRALPRLPWHYGDLLISTQVCAGFLCGLLHRRMAAQGIAVNMSYIRSGMWNGGSTLAPVVAVPTLCTLVLKNYEICRRTWPLITCNSHRTKDGVWIQMLCVESGRGLKCFWAAMGPWYRARLLNAVSKGGADYLWAKLSPFDHSSMVERSAPLLGYLFDVIESFISNHTIEEMEHLDETYGLWFTRINKPEDACRVEQAHDTGIWGTAANGKKFVTAPFNLSDCPPVRSGVRPLAEPGVLTQLSRL